MFNAPNTKTNRIAAIIVVILGLIVGFYLATRGGSDDADVTPPPEAPIQTTPETPTTPDPGPTDPTEIITAQTVTIPGVEIGMDSIEAEDAIEAFLKPKTSEGNQTYNMRLTPQTQNGYSLIAVADNMLDDSLKAQEITAIFTPGSVDGTFVLSEYTSKVKCRRGTGDAWQTKRCS